MIFKIQLKVTCKNIFESRGLLQALFNDSGIYFEYHVFFSVGRVKEAVARSALNRSEAERVGLREENLRLLRSIRQLEAANANLADNAR